MSKPLKSHAVCLTEIKNQQGRKFDDMHVQRKEKIDKLTMRKMATSRKSKTHDRQ